MQADREVPVLPHIPIVHGSGRAMQRDGHLFELHRLFSTQKLCIVGRFKSLVPVLNQVVFFEKNGSNQKWEQVNYKANSVLMNLRLKYRKELNQNLV